MGTTKKSSNILAVVMLLGSTLFIPSCAPDPGYLEAKNSASINCRNLIGIEVSNITDEQRAATKYVGDGIYVSAVIPKHPADMAGLKAGDIIISIDSIPVSDVSEALMVVNGLEAGRRYPFRVFRLRAKSSPKSFTSAILIFTTLVLIEKVQERSIGRIS